MAQQGFEQSTMQMLFEIVKDSSVKIEEAYFDGDSKGLKFEKDGQEIFHIYKHRFKGKDNYVLVINGEVMAWDQNMLKSMYLDLAGMYEQRKTKAKDAKKAEKRVAITDFLSRFLSR